MIGVRTLMETIVEWITARRRATERDASISQAAQETARLADVLRRADWEIDRLESRRADC